jgi:hypothetical protein
MKRAVLAILLVAWLALAASAGARSTAVTRYEPFDELGDVDPSLHLSSRYGNCWVGSLVSTRADAWRCISGHVIHDPCFSSEDMDFVVCPTDPWKNRAIRLYLDEALPESYGNEPGHGATAWALELFNSRKCYFSSGASDVIGGQRVNYFCSSNYALVGFANKRARVWRIPMVHYPEKGRLRSVAIRTAWR